MNTEKRFLLAFTLSFLILLVYSSVFQKKQPIDKKEVTKISIANSIEPSQPSVAAPSLLSAPAGISSKMSESAQDYHNILQNSELYIIEGNRLALIFSKKGGFLQAVYDKASNAYLAFSNIGLVEEWQDYNFQVTELPRGVVFEFMGEDGYKIRKTFRLKSDNTLELIIGFYDITSSKITSYNIISGYFNPYDIKDPLSQRYYELSASQNSLVVRKPAGSLKNGSEIDGKIKWLGLRDRYYCTIMIPQLDIIKAVMRKLDKGSLWALSISERPASSPSLPVEDIYRIYIGPQDEHLIKEFNEGSEQIINFGVFDAISKALQFLLKTCYKVTHNWGWAIILITIIVYSLLFPLSLKGMLSMKKMQALQPKIEEIKAKHKDSPQKLNAEIMELYKREKANPFSGCIPMILQIPVFLALYQLLMRFISLRGASFLWIKDLSEPDRLIEFKSALPLLGKELNILPLLMAVVMFLQQKFTMQAAATSPEAVEQQKIMSIVMPVVFGALFYRMSSGLVLYWFTNSLLMFAFQWKISKRKA